MKYALVKVTMIFVFLSLGCGKEKPPIDQKKIVNILMDVHIAEGLIRSHHPVAMKDSLEKRYLAQILNKWGASRDVFESALNHMHGDPDYMREVYKLVQDQVKEFSKELDDEESKQEERKEPM